MDNNREQAVPLRGCEFITELPKTERPELWKMTTHNNKVILAHPELWPLKINTDKETAARLLSF